MAAAARTPNLNLPQWVNNESLIGIMNDINAAFLAIDDKLAINGWIPAGETWTRTTASVFTVPSDVTGKYQKGDKIKWMQTTGRFAYIASVGAYAGGVTPITITGSSDYSLDAAAITLPHWSRQVCPFAFPEWFSFPVVPSGPAGSAGTFAQASNAGIYCIKGKTCLVRIATTIVNKGSWSGNFYLGLPIVRLNLGRVENNFNGSFAATNTNPVTASRGFPTGDGTSYVSFVKMSQTSSVQWADVAVNDQIVVNGEYPI